MAEPSVDDLSRPSPSSLSFSPELVPTDRPVGILTRSNFSLDFQNTNESNVENAEHQDIESQFQRIQQNSGRLLIYGSLHDCKWPDFKKICYLGHGVCGEVSKYLYQNIPMAVKTMPRTTVLEEDKRVLRDLDVITRTGDCPTIVKCFGYFITPVYVRICMEAMATCLDNLLKDKLRNEPFPEDILGKIVVSVLDALVYLKNTHNVIHRDVKPANILVNYDGKIKICDFGISGILVESMAHTHTGTTAYIAPERHAIDDYKSNYDVRSDVWALGLTTVELATGKYPYVATNEFEYLAAILECPAPQLRVEDGFAPDLSYFASRTVNKNVNERPFYPEILMSRQHGKYPYIIRMRKNEADMGAWLEDVMTRSV